MAPHEASRLYLEKIFKEQKALTRTGSDLRRRPAIPMDLQKSSSLPLFPQEIVHSAKLRRREARINRLVRRNCGHGKLESKILTII
mmetsp:Transcript_110926/g.195965  ORF Transcript_110926/g.195965 Transcript_110926/m.195965 type:complete len:86 (+) Transcript_110926:3-260(+)